MTDMATQRDAIDKVIDSAAHMGVEINEQEAEQWIAAMAAESAGGDIVVDVDSGVFGHKASMLDLESRGPRPFSADCPDRRLREPPRREDCAGAFRFFCAGKIQDYPADADFFERIHITAPTREEAGRILGDVIRDKALSTLSGPSHRLTEVKLGTWDVEVTKDGKKQKAGNPITWSPAEVESGEMNVVNPDGAARTVKWEDCGPEPRVVQARLGRG